MRAGVAVLLVAVVLVSVAEVLRHAPTPPSGTRPPVSAPVVIGGQSESPGGRHRDPPPEQDASPHTTRPPAPEATAAARRFAQAYLRWEAGASGAAVENTLRDLAEPELWALLEAGRGGATGHVAITPRRLRRLIGGATDTDDAATILAALRGQGADGSLGIVVRKRGGVWRVSSIGP